MKLYIATYSDLEERFGIVSENLDKLIADSFAEEHGRDMDPQDVMFHSLLVEADGVTTMKGTTIREIKLENEFPI